MGRCGPDGARTGHTVIVSLLLQTIKFLTIVADGIVGCTSHKTGKGQGHIVGSIGKLFVTTYSLLGH